MYELIIKTQKSYVWINFISASIIVKLQVKLMILLHLNDKDYFMYH